MITIEEKLKELILTRYHSIREFTIETGIAYSTVDSILKRGVQNSNVSNIIKICNTLHISVDALAEGKIITVTIVDNNEITPAPLDIEDMIRDFKSYLISHKITLEGKLLTKESICEFNDFMDMGIELVKRHIK